MMVVALAVVGGLTVKANTASAAGCTSTFTMSLKEGMTNSQVMCLQQDLNAVGSTVSTSGAGSPGNETDYFGPATQAAVINFQTKNSVTPAVGYFGPLTQAAMAVALNASTSMSNLPAGCTSTAGYSPINGQPCNSMTTTTTYPAGCTSAVGYSTTTGFPCSSTTTVQGNGPVSVMLATDNPASGNLIQGQATADLAHFAFSGNGTLTQLTLQRTGISDNSVFPNVYLYSGNTRLTDSASVNSQGQITFNGLNIPVNGTLDISVRADIVATGNESTVAVTLTSYMVSGSTTATTVNIPGNSFYINSGTGILSTVSVGTNTVSAQSVSAGTTQMALWSAPINVSLHPVWLKSASFDAIGSAPSNALANLGLFANGVKIGTSTGINAMGYITFDLTAAPYELPTGATTLEVRGDVVNGSARTIQLSLQHASDLMVTDSQVNVNVGVTTQSQTTFTINQAGVITILQGTLVAQSDPVFNSQTNVTGGASNVAIASYQLTSYGEDVKINTVTVTPVITGSPAACNALTSGQVGLENVTLYYNNAPVGSSQNAVSTGGCAFTPLVFTPGSNLTISGGTTGTFQVRADLINYAGTPQYSSGTIGATVVINQYQGISSGQTGSLSLSGSNSMTIATGSLTIGSNQNYLAQTISPNTSGAEIGSFTLSNQSTSEAVQVNSLDIGLCSSTTTYSVSGGCVTPFGTLTDISSLTLAGFNSSSQSVSLNGNSPVTPIGQPTASNVFSTNFEIPAGSSVTVNVMANLGSTTGTSFATSLLPVAVGANSRVTITTSGVPGQLITLGVGTISNPTLVASQTTAAQYLPTGGNGSTNSAEETYNFFSTTGTASVVGLKFAALAGTSSAAYSGTTASTTVANYSTSTLPETLTVGAFSGYTADSTATPAICNSSSAQCNFLVTTTGIYGGTNAVVTGYFTSSTALVVTAFQTAMVAGSSSPSSIVTGVPSTIYQLATTGVTNVALNSAGIGMATAPFNNGIAYISAISGSTNPNCAITTGVCVPNNPSGVTLPAFLSFGPVNTNGGVASGTPAQVLLEYVQYQTGSNTSYLAPSIPGTILTLVGSIPTMTVNPVSNSLALGTDVLLGTVTVTASPTGDIALSDIPLTASVNDGNGGSGVTIASGSLKITDNNDVALAGPVTTTNSSITTTGSSTNVFGSANANHYRISAGTSKTFEIHGTVSGTLGAGASISVGLGANTVFAWDDINGNNISTVATNGTISVNNLGGPSLTGALLYAYPNTSVSIHN